MAWWIFFPVAVAGTVVFVLFVGLLLRWIVLPVAGHGSLVPCSGRTDAAQQILRERYARGEISKEQLDQMSKELNQN